ncbi:MAG: alpha/beta fold hydrolase [Solirubrobacterales bacterium]|nr:alpha/beta fold hydrolase [Solirubrobacterales bacterium]
MAHVDVDGRELFYRRDGTGEPLLLVQGMSGTHLAWGDAFVGELDRDFDVITYDHRGVGHSARVTAPFSIADLAEDAAGLLDALEIEDAHVLGISMGGMVAQELAVRHPARVRTLALGCTYPGGAEARLTDPAVMHRLAEAIASGDHERALRIGYEANVSAAFAGDSANYEPFHEMATQLPVGLEVLMLQLQAIQAHDAAGRLAGIEAPTLVVHGTEDQMLPVVNGELIARLIPGARLELLPRIGHMFWWEQPQRSAALVREHALGAVPARPN